MSARKVGKKRWNVTGRVLGGGRRTRAVRLGGAEQNRPMRLGLWGEHLQRLRRTVRHARRQRHERRTAAAARQAGVEAILSVAGVANLAGLSRLASLSIIRLGRRTRRSSADRQRRDTGRNTSHGRRGRNDGEQERLHGDRIGRHQRYPGARARLQFHGLNLVHFPPS
jgi:hypothetical protein